MMPSSSSSSLSSSSHLQPRVRWPSSVESSSVGSSSVGAKNLGSVSESVLLDSTQGSSWAPPKGILLAQADADDAYDPFADYSEFEEAMDEEEDVNFFRNGRLLTMGFLAGARGFSSNLGRAYATSPGFGLYLCYFFDLRFAVQFGFNTSDHPLNVKGKAGTTPLQGTVAITDLAFNIKYYLNTQNVTRGLAELSPYLIGGFSQVYRTTTLSGKDGFAKDASFAFQIGGGIEIPMMRNKMYFGVQGAYQIINFPDEGKNVVDENLNDTGFQLAGDSFQVFGILGINF
jgi:hypothetical protein